MVKFNTERQHLPTSVFIFLCLGLILPEVWAFGPVAVGAAWLSRGLQG